MIHILSASQTGTAEDVASELEAFLSSQGHQVTAVDLCDTDDIGFLSTAHMIVGVVSTWGDGEPPDDAVEFFDNLTGAEPLGLSESRFSVIGLGDSGYDLFCECGKILERELLRHGAKPLLPRVDCDVWYEDEIAQWKSDFQEALTVAS